MSFAESFNPYSEKCHLGSDKNNFQHPLEGCTDFLVNGSAQVMMIGDSHSNAISYQVQKELKNYGIGSYAVSYSNCIGLRGLYIVSLDSSHKCNEYNNSMIEFAKKIGIKTLVITSRFPVYLDGRGFDNNEGGVELGNNGFVDLIEQRNNKFTWNSNDRKQRVKAYYKKALEELLIDFNVVFVEPIPEVGWNAPMYIAKSNFLHLKNTNLSTSLIVYNKRNNDIFDILNSINSKKLVRVSSRDFFCSQIINRCIFADEKGVFYRDDNHLSQYGAELLAPSIVNAINKSFLNP